MEYTKIFADYITKMKYTDIKYNIEEKNGKFIARLYIPNTNIIGIGKPEENEYISNEKLCNYLVNKFIFKN